MATPSVFDLASAQRIASAVRRVEIGDRAEEPLRFRRVFEDPKRIFRIGIFDGSWSKDTEKTVTFRFKTNTPNTVVATNLFLDIGDQGGTQTVAIAKEGTAWYLIEYPPPEAGVVKIATFTGDWSKNSFKTVTWKYDTSTPNTASALNLFVDYPDRSNGGQAFDCAVAQEGEDWFLVSWEWSTVTSMQVTLKSEAPLQSVVASINTNDCMISITPTFVTISVVSTTYNLDIVQVGRESPP